MTTIGSSSSFYSATGRQSGMDRSKADAVFDDGAGQPGAPSGGARPDASANGRMTDSQRFTREHAHLSASEYIFAKLAFSEQRSAERLRAGEATDTFSVRFGDRIFTLAGKMMDASALQAAEVSDAPRAQLAGPAQYPDMQAPANAYDFSDMSRQEIADLGRELFGAGKITLDELFVFEHPDGLLRIGENNAPAVPNPDDRIDLAASIREAVRNMEQTYQAGRPDSRYGSMVGLLEKLSTL